MTTLPGKQCTVVPFCQIFSFPHSRIEASKTSSASVFCNTDKISSSLNYIVQHGCFVRYWAPFCIFNCDVCRNSFRYFIIADGAQNSVLYVDSTCGYFPSSLLLYDTKFSRIRAPFNALFRPSTAQPHPWQLKCYSAFLLVLADRLMVHWRSANCPCLVMQVANNLDMNTSLSDDFFLFPPLLFSFWHKVLNSGDFPCFV